MKNEEITQEPLDTEDNVIELWNQLEAVNEKILPVKQAYNELMHQKEQINIRIKKSQHAYFANKGK